MTRGVADLLGVGVGATWTQAGAARQVVGLVEDPRDLDDQFVLAPPGQLDRGRHRHRPVLRRPPSGSPRGAAATERDAPRDRRRVARVAAVAAVAVLALGTLGLLLVGLVAVAGFSVVARRRQRALGMLGAIGATDRPRPARDARQRRGGRRDGGRRRRRRRPRRLVRPRPASRRRCRTPHRPLRSSRGWPSPPPDCSPWPPHSPPPGGRRGRRRGRRRWPPSPADRRGPSRPAASRRWAASCSPAGCWRSPSPTSSKPCFVVIGIIATVVGRAPVRPARHPRPRGRRPSARRWPSGMALRDLARYQARSGAALGAATLAVGIAGIVSVSAASHIAPGRSQRLQPGR